MKTIRKPKLTEVTGIKKLLDQASKDGHVLARPLMELYETVRDFVVYVDEEGVAGCCALTIDMIDLAEIRSLVVRPDLRGQKIGQRLLGACLDEARELDIDRVFALTRAPGFFKKNGFVEVDMHTLPHKVFMDCVKCPLFPDCDEIAVIRHLKTQEDAEPGRE
ncbi:MAG: amino-acid N-acetyltransferase [Candidatus Hydrogenedentes bacterium]|nr:amino-acid N-acetyltransferase [Candidatus Hydrogenedentota bacterium]